MEKEEAEFIQERETKLGYKIKWRTFSTWFGSNRGILREYGVFLCSFSDSLYLEDFERLPTFLGYPINRKNREKYVMYDRIIHSRDIVSIRRVRKSDAEKTIRAKGTIPLSEASGITQVFAKMVTQVELKDGELLYFELISNKEFVNTCKELQNGSF